MAPEIAGCLSCCYDDCPIAWKKEALQTWERAANIDLTQYDSERGG